jgi:hypothetical protein
MTDSREAFETWVRNSGEFTDWSRDKTSENNPYHKPRVELAWQSWRAAVKTIIDGAYACEVCGCAVYRDLPTAVHRT